MYLKKIFVSICWVLAIFLSLFRTMHQQLCQELQKENVDLVAQSSLPAKERHLAAVASALWRHFFSFLKSQRMSQIVPLPQLADAAAGQLCNLFLILQTIVSFFFCLLGKNSYFITVVINILTTRKTKRIIYF